MSTLSKKKEFEEKFDLYSVSFWDGKYPNAYKEGKTKLWSFIASALKDCQREERRKVISHLLKRLPKEIEAYGLQIDFPITDSKEDEPNRRKMIMLGERTGYNNALSEVKTILKLEMKKMKINFIKYRLNCFLTKVWRCWILSVHDIENLRCQRCGKIITHPYF